MAKSKRSKVKMAYKAMRRSVMQPLHDKKLREQAAKVYGAIGLQMPDERAEEQKMKPRSHGGSELVTTFMPTPKGPKLNVVHGPNAVDNEMMRMPEQVVGLPIVGAATAARVRHETGMDVDAEGLEEEEERPYFYPRRERKKGGIKKKRKNQKGKSGKK